MTRPRSWIAGSTIAACALACAWFAAGYPTLIYDSLGYYILSIVVRTGGIARWPTDTWTYGYPLFAALVTGWRALSPEEFRLDPVRRAARGVARGVGARRASDRRGARARPGIAVAAYAISALNPVLLLQTSEPLSDLLSAALILAAVALAWREPGEGPAGPSAWRPFLSLLAAAGAAAVRPANVVVAAALVGVWLLRAALFRDLRGRHVAAGLAGLVPPFLPQAAINYFTFGVANPLIRKNLYHLQTSWGMGALKYATMVVPGKSPFLVYGNPLFRGDASPGGVPPKAPRALRRDALPPRIRAARPRSALHVRDQPRAVVPLSARASRTSPCCISRSRGRCSRCSGSPGAGAWTTPASSSVSTLIVAGGYLALYLPVEVECRFGVAIQALAMPLILAGWAAVRGRTPRRLVARVFVLGFAPVALAGALALSAWITRQRTNPYVESPANAVVMGPKRAPRPSSSP